MKLFEFILVVAELWLRDCNRFAFWRLWTLLPTFDSTFTSHLFAEAVDDERLASLLLTVVNTPQRLGSTDELIIHVAVPIRTRTGVLACIWISR